MAISGIFGWLPIFTFRRQGGVAQGKRYMQTTQVGIRNKKRGGLTMLNSNGAGDRTTRWIRWIARIWGTLVIAVIVLILVGYLSNWVRTGTADPYAAEDYPPIENLPPLFMLLSAVGLGMAWRWEGWGGAIAVLFQLANLPVLLIHWPIAEGFPRYLIAPYGISLIVAVPGILFLVCWWRSRESGKT